ncbi:COR domain-containing protein [Verrucomicrobium sp. BvORR106]|uniref:COR domain-containing protein n=1 Tax=Verrucomicrobium sp. BvORR106 TaxID=1403819 RepID=UPI00056E893A|nr:COR domain-containing protein [Verrucomicrobium sp. BvORR106]
MTQLHTLWLEENPLLALPEWLGKLPHLQRLSVGHCQLRELPDLFGSWRKLTHLNASANFLDQLPQSLEECRDLESLWLEDNHLQSLPACLKQMSRLKRLHLRGNSALSIPDHVLGPKHFEINSQSGVLPARPADILDYYFRTKTGQARRLNEVKLLLVGRGKAGKSSLRDKLVHNHFDPNKPETPGIDIQPWNLNCHGENLRLRVWDFAGQEITHATHQFFLTERSVYVLVLEGRTDNQDRDAEYWLSLITAFGGDSPIIVALNQWELRPFEVDQNLLHERYPAIKAFIQTDCATGLGIDTLQSALCDILRGQQGVRQLFPLPWWSVKEHFSAPDRNYLPFSEYRAICDQKGLKEINEQSSLARILHALGIILHYGDDPRLKDTTVLNPQWVTNGVYRILRIKDGQNSDGTLTLAEACHALPEDPEDMVLYLIELMRRFELCYALDDHDKRWLVPQVLTRYQPKLDPAWSSAPATRLRYTYKVIPEGLLPRFIVRTHPLSEGLQRWRNGVVLALDGAQALVKTELSESRITVTVQGKDAPRLRLVQLVRAHMRHIHRNLRGFQPVEEMEIAGSPGTYKDVAILEKDEQNRAVTTIDTAAGSVQVQQTEQLDTISTKEARKDDHPAIKAFLSYSRHNHRHRDSLLQNLTILEENGHITSWYDRLIRAGENWDQRIIEELESSDIIIFMVSTSFFATDYIRSVEMTRAMKRHQAGEVEILVLVLESDCPWEEPHKLIDRDTHEVTHCDLSKFQVIHPKRNADRWSATSGSFNHVDKELKAARDRILARRRECQAP